MISRIGAFFAVVGLLAAAPASAAVLYDNGPIDGTTDAYNIATYVTADSFDLSTPSTVTGVNFGAWTDPSEMITSIDWSITSLAEAGTIYGSGTASVTSSFQFTTILPGPVTYDISWDSFTIPSLNLVSGTYWLNLTNAVTTNNGSAYWDQNGGPSSAEQDGGSLPSESFQIIGTANSSPPPTSVPEPGSLALLLPGLVGLAGFSTVRKRKVA
jgi:hypothetical protein